jgi:hypothetical protein
MLVPSDTAANAVSMLRYTRCVVERRRGKVREECGERREK